MPMLLEVTAKMAVRHAATPIVILYGGTRPMTNRPVKEVVRFCANVPAVYPALWTFWRVPGVETTNNRAERTLRPAVIRRKMSLGNWSEAGCRFAERIPTCLRRQATVQTLRVRNREVPAYLHQAVAAHRCGQPAPSLVGTRA